MATKKSTKSMLPVEEVTNRTYSLLARMKRAHKSGTRLVVSPEDCGAMFESFNAQMSAADSLEAVKAGEIKLVSVIAMVLEKK